MPLPAKLSEVLEQFQWPDRWRCLIDAEPEERQYLDAQLRQELPNSHVLFPFRHGIHAIARRDDCDDVLYWVDGADKPVAMVHLTFARTPEPVHDHPWTARYESLAAFAEADRLEA